MIIAWQNQLDDAILTGSGFVSSLPVTNVQVNPVGLVARKTGTSATFGFDAGSSKSWRVFALLGTNLTSAATIQVKLSDVSVGGTDVHDTGAVSAGVIEGYPQVYVLLTAALSARYVQVIVTDASLSNIDVGRIFGGPVWEPTVGDQFGRGIRWVDPSTSQESLGGQLLFNQRTKFRETTFVLQFNSETEMLTNAFEADRTQGLSDDVLVMLDPINQKQKLSVWGVVTRSTELVHWTFDVVRKQYTIRERL